MRQLTCCRAIIPRIRFAGPYRQCIPFVMLYRLVKPNIEELCLEFATRLKPWFYETHATRVTEEIVAACRIVCGPRKPRFAKHPDRYAGLPAFSETKIQKYSGLGDFTRNNMFDKNNAVVYYFRCVYWGLSGCGSHIYDTFHSLPIHTNRVFFALASRVFDTAFSKLLNCNAMGNSVHTNSNGGMSWQM